MLFSTFLFIFGSSLASSHQGSPTLCFRSFFLQNHKWFFYALFRHKHKRLSFPERSQIISSHRFKFFDQNITNAVSEYGPFLVHADFVHYSVSISFTLDQSIEMGRGLCDACQKGDGHLWISLDMRWQLVVWPVKFFTLMYDSFRHWRAAGNSQATCSRPLPRVFAALKCRVDS